ncbi:CvpA family protein [Candidatus Uhrbacteria bacterium]|nr:CvpA family protein [Candidatus Uhrbacteria bacterium]
MGFIDIVLMVIVGAFVFFGFFFGLVHTLGSLLGTIVGTLFASRLVDPAFETFGFLFGGGTISRIIVFILIFFIITRLLGIVFWFVGRIFNVLAWIPFARSLDKFLGGLFGCVEGVIVVGVVLFYAMLVLPDDALRTTLETSVVADFLLTIMSVLQVFFPEAARQSVESATNSAVTVISEPVQ